MKKLLFLLLLTYKCSAFLQQDLDCAICISRRNKANEVVPKEYRDLSSANLSSAKLYGEDFSYIKLGGANLEKAIMTKAKLFFTNLSGAKLTDAQLNEADLTGANLTEATISGVNFKGAVYNRKTIWIDSKPIQKDTAEALGMIFKLTKKLDTIPEED